jgi:hypothetical protein
MNYIEKCCKNSDENTHGTYKVCSEIYGLLKSLVCNVNCKIMYSQSLTVTKQLPELEASLEVSFALLKFELSSTIAAPGT